MFQAVLFIFLVLKTVYGGDQCVWYDTCGWDQDYGPDGGNMVHFLNCHYTGPPKPATTEQVELVRELCPHLYTEGEVRAKSVILYTLFNEYSSGLEPLLQPSTVAGFEAELWNTTSTN